MKNTFRLILLFTSTWSYANLTGEYHAEFNRNGMECVLESKLQHLKANTVKFIRWDEYCEDLKGNSYESSLEDQMTYTKQKDGVIKVTQGKESVEVKSSITNFSKDKVHYRFEVETEDGHLDIEESFELKDKKINYFSRYILEGEVIIDKSGILEKVK